MTFGVSNGDGEGTITHSVGYLYLAEREKKTLLKRTQAFLL